MAKQVITIEIDVDSYPDAADQWYIRKDLKGDIEQFLERCNVTGKVKSEAQ